MEIIRKGKTHKIATCSHCGCVFSYQTCETYQNRLHFYVDCPDCHLPNITGEINKENNIIKEDQ